MGRNYEEKRKKDENKFILETGLVAETKTKTKRKKRNLAILAIDNLSGSYG